MHCGRYLRTRRRSGGCEVSGEADQLLTAITEFVETMCEIAVAEATGFYRGAALEAKRTEAKEAFAKVYNSYQQDGGP